MNTYESIAIIKKLPNISETQQQAASKSIEHYSKLLDSDEFKKAAFKNILISITVSLMTYYKNSLNLDEVFGLDDVVCNFDPTPMLDNYPTFRIRLNTLLDTIEKGQVTDINQKFLKSLGSVRNMPQDLDADDKEYFITEFEDFQVKLCN